MADYFLLVKVFSRGKGSSVTRAAAYRAGERIRDDNSMLVYDFSRRTDVVESQIVLPSEDADNTDLDWARNRSLLWNAVQRSGRQWNSRLAREVLVLLPRELNFAQRSALVRSFSQELADRYHCVVDFAIHGERSNLNAKNHHAHILMTSRQIEPKGVGARTTFELSGTERHQRGLGTSKQEFLWTLERWAQVGNEALRSAGLTPDLDHRSYASRGINREPSVVIPRKIFHLERRLGMSTPAGDALRAEHRERLEARKKGPQELDRVLTRQREEALRSARSKEAPSRERQIPRGALSREQLHAKRREYYLANKARIDQKEREWRRAHRTEINRRKREYYRAHAVEMARKELVRRHKRELAKAAANASKDSMSKSAPSLLGMGSTGLTPPLSKWQAYRESQKGIVREDPLAKWRTYRKAQQEAESKSREANPNGGLSKWQAYRESQKGIVREDPIEKWRAYRKAQLEKAESKSRDTHRLGDTEKDSGLGKGLSPKQKRGPKNDLGL